MTDFVITEDELIGAEFGELDRCECEHIRSRPLSDELKKERERVLEEILKPATEENKKDGWNLNVKWLVDIHRNLPSEGDSICLEDIEFVILALVESLRG